MKPPYAIVSVPILSGLAIAYRWRPLPTVRRHRASKPQGSFERVLPWQIPMDQLIKRHRYAIAWPDKLGTDPMAYGGLNKDMDAAAEFRSNPLT